MAFSPTRDFSNVMKTRMKLLAGFLMVLASLFIVISIGPDKPEPASVVNPPYHAKTQPRAPAVTADSPSGFQVPAGAVRTSAASHASPAAAKDAAIEAIHEAATSYDPAQLVVIRPYLTSADAELRAAAVDAMIVLGDASAGDMLRQAALTIGSGEEATEMMKAADYLELPSANLKNLTRKAQDRPSQRTPAN